MQNLDSKIRQMNDVDGPVLSLYLTTTHDGTSAGSHAIHFKNLMREAEDKLSGQMDRNQLQKTMKILQDIQKDTVFWNSRSEAFALFLRDNDLLIYDLSEAVKPSVHVQDVLDLLPLLTAEQHLPSHYILDLSRDRFNLFFGDGAKITEVKDHGLLTFAELYDDFDANANLNFGTYAGKAGAFHGHRSISEMREIDREKYYRYLNENLTPIFLEEGIYVVLSGVKATIADWRAINSNSIYLKEDLGKPLQDFDSQSLKSTIADIFESFQTERLDRGMKSLTKALTDNKAATDPDQIKKAIDENKVDSLYIRNDYRETDKAKYNLLVRDCFRQGGDVIMVPLNLRTMDHKIAARFRY